LKSLNEIKSPDKDCDFCPRLHGFIAYNRVKFPQFHNAPVPNFGEESAQLLIVGLAPGLKGANRTGRPFTGDYAGDLLYETLIEFGFASGKFEARIDDSLELLNCRITNAVRCVPPDNKPTPLETNTCRRFLEATITPSVKAIVCLGRISHESTLRALGVKLSAYPFKHGAIHEIKGLKLFDSYHCSRYNTNTGVLTSAMFKAVFHEVALDIENRILYG
jgi:uracil-DNA glycosylase